MMIDLRAFIRSGLVLAGLLLLNQFAFGEYISHLQLILIYVAINAVFLAAVLFQRRKARSRDGWHYLTPGLMEWAGVILSFGLAALLLWVYYFVGSDRSDADTQMQIVIWMILVFASGGAICFYFSFLASMRWNDHRIEYLVPFRSPQTILFRYITDVHYERWSESFVIEDEDGQRIRIPTFRNGVQSLMQAIGHDAKPAAQT